MTTTVPYIGVQTSPSRDGEVALLLVETTQGFSIVQAEADPEYSAIRTPMGIFYSQATPIQVMDTISEVRARAAIEAAVRGHELAIEASASGRFGSGPSTPDGHTEDNGA